MKQQSTTNDSKTEELINGNEELRSFLIILICV